MADLPLPRAHAHAAEAPAMPLSAESFRRIQAHLLRRTGIALSEQKRQMAQTRLGRRLRALRMDSFEAYLRILEDEDSPEWEAFVNALTTNVTQFFREKHHFELLAAHLAPRVEAGAFRHRPVRLWSAGCSTGQEPYSLVLSLWAAFGGGLDFRVLATDVDSQVLETAARGIYPIKELESVPAELVRTGFLRGTGSSEGRVRVRPEVQAHVTFRRMNLLEDAWQFREPFDAIFCRNVMIYFDKPTRRRVVEGFHRNLAPGGMLLIGHSESLLDAGNRFRALGGTAFLRVEGAP